jgi:hypothetical protein
VIERERRAFMLWTIMSSFGSGLVLPITAIFLVSRTYLGVAGVAAYFAVAAAAEVGTSSALATVRARLSPGALGGSGYLVLAIGYALLGSAKGLTAVLAIAVVVGLGRGASAGGLSAFLRQTTDDEQLGDVFARRYRALNIGLGTGLLAATVVLSLASSAVLPGLFIANGATFVPLAIYLIRRRASGRPAAAAAPGDIGAPGLSLSRLIRRAGPKCLVDLCIFAFAYSQFDSSLPLTATRLSHARLGFVSAIVAVNTVAVIVLQPYVTRALRRWSPGHGMQVTMVSWLAGYVIALAASSRPGVVSWAGLAVLAVLFAGGEAAYASSYQPWLFAAVPKSESIRVSSLSNVTSSVGLSLGPSLGALLVTTGQPALVWASLAGGCAMTLGLVTAIVRPDRPPVVITEMTGLAKEGTS